MKLVVTGHRLHKLQSYNIDWIKTAIRNFLQEESNKVFIRGYAGMASGVDLWFCEACRDFSIQYVACLPFDGQELQMSENDRLLRQSLIDNASEVRKVKNSWMVEQCDSGLVIFDGNKGGTHNVLQQLVERKKPFWWINPVSQKIYDCR